MNKLYIISSSCFLSGMVAMLLLGGNHQASSQVFDQAPMQSIDVSWAKTTYPSNTTGVLDATVNSNRSCLNLRDKENKILKCVPNDTKVQVWLNPSKGIDMERRGNFSYIFVLLYDGSKGWMEVSSVLPDNIALPTSVPVVAIPAQPQANTALATQAIESDSTACIGKLKTIVDIATK